MTKRLAIPLLLAALVALFFNPLAFTNLILARGDTYLYFYPYWQAAQDALLAGRIPLWNPDIFMGAPLLANSQMGFFYPLNWPLWALLLVPYAVSATIILHIWIAALGTHALARRLRLGREAAVLAAVLFALGGYLTAQVEHVNQLQGLAWLPWLLWAVVRRGAGEQRGGGAEGKTTTYYLLLTTYSSVFFALQLLAGHTQTVFITGIAAVLVVIGQGTMDKGQRTTLSSLFSLLSSTLLALLIAAVQLLPTLELTRYSSRAGGLTTNEVLSFSWHPLLAAQSLLPNYIGHTFSEYIAFVPITALLLAVVGAWQWRHSLAARLGLALSGLGLWLALGRFGGLYLLLAHLPGFDLFRVPARWLVLYALGIALLAAVGWEKARRNGFSRSPLVVAALAVLVLIAWGYAAVPLGRFLPTGPEAPLNWPNAWNTAAQIAELVIGYWLLVIGSKLQVTSYKVVPHLLLFISFLLFLATRPLPANHPTTPEAYFDQRPPSLRLHTLPNGRDVPGRFLSLSQTFFDPGDQVEIDTIYAGRLSERARYDYTIAIKQKEILAPNLGMVYHLPSLDGFDGGVLPLRSYSDLMADTILAGQLTTDGRLREFLPAIPSAEWLDWFNVRTLITDKVGDAWVNGVYFDLQHPATLSAGEQIAVGYIPSFTATHVLLHAPTAAGTLNTLPLSAWADGVWAAELPQAAVPASLTLQANQEWLVQGVTLFNEEAAAFQPLVLGQYRLIHSGDVKIYENLDVRPRAWAVAELSCPLRDESCVVGYPTVANYTAEHVTLHTNFPTAAWLVLGDAHYPGWQATVSGQPAEVVGYGGFFRAVFVPAGAQVVEMEFRPWGFVVGRWLSLVGLLVLGGGLLKLSFSRKGSPNLLPVLQSTCALMMCSRL
ncbi:MAG: hypothetical protein OT477_06775 [Chloroflexi bacterium]|nr:hypothetical protein [Chloroflexota bacterium]